MDGGGQMVKKLTKHGNSHALVIDRPVLDLLNIDPESDELDIRTDGLSLVITPVRDAKRQKKFEDALKRVNEKYGRMLKNLA
jgi:antitoxin MazE